jgi:hypothetical protein
MHLENVELELVSYLEVTFGEGEGDPRYLEDGG